jgi:hypothetical protein
MTTQLVNSLTVDERKKTTAESAAEVLAPKRKKTTAESAAEVLAPKRKKTTAESAAEVLAPKRKKTAAESAAETPRRKKKAAESAEEALAPSNSPQLVSSLTVDELMEVVANVVDARLNSFFSSLNINGEKKSSESETLESTEVEKENPWLKMAGLHKDNPLFEEVVAYIEANRENDFAEELR